MVNSLVYKVRSMKLSVSLDLTYELGSADLEILLVNVGAVRANDYRLTRDTGLKSSENGDRQGTIRSGVPHSNDEDDDWD